MRNKKRPAAPRPPFQITIRPVKWLTPCAAYHAEQARGLIGFHNSDKCPDCKIEAGGFDLWGENGHLQGHCNDTSPETLARLQVAYSRSGPVQFTVSDSGYTYLR